RRCWRRPGLRTCGEVAATCSSDRQWGRPVRVGTDASRRHGGPDRQREGVHVVQPRRRAGCRRRRGPARWGTTHPHAGPGSRGPSRGASTESEPGKTIRRGAVAWKTCCFGSVGLAGPPASLYARLPSWGVFAVCTTLPASKSAPCCLRGSQRWSSAAWVTWLLLRSAPAAKLRYQGNATAFPFRGFVGPNSFGHGVTGDDACE